MFLQSTPYTPPTCTSPAPSQLPTSTLPAPSWATESTPGCTPSLCRSIPRSGQQKQLSFRCRSSLLQWDFFLCQNKFPEKCGKNYLLGLEGCFPPGWVRVYRSLAQRCPSWVLPWGHNLRIRGLLFWWHLRSWHGCPLEGLWSFSSISDCLLL